MQARNAESARRLLGAAIAAGFRESGVVPARKGTKWIVGIRTSLRLDAPVAQVGGGDDAPIRLLVEPDYLRTLMDMANTRFADNARRRERLREGIEALARPQ